MKGNDDKWMMYIVILLFLTIGVLFVQLIFVDSESEGEVLAQAGTGNGECYTNWDSFGCPEGFTAIIKGKWTVVTDPLPIIGEASCGCDEDNAPYVIPETEEMILMPFSEDSWISSIWDGGISGFLGISLEPPPPDEGSEYGYGSVVVDCECPGGAGDRICANIPDKDEIATWGLVVEQSNIDCAICCKI